MTELSNARKVSSLDGRTSAKWFLATGDGTTDDQASMQLFLNAVALGMPGYIPQGEYSISSGLGVNITADFDLVVHSKAIIKAAVGFPGNDKLIQFTAGSGTDHLFSWKGGELNGENVPNSLPGEANDLFSFSDAAVCSSVTIHLDRTYTGADWLTAGGDSHIFCLANNADIYIKEAIGAVDAAVYASGDSTDSTQGHRLRVRGNFKKCLNACVVKRDYQDIDIDILTEDCVNGAGYTSGGTVGGLDTFGGDGGFIKVTSRSTERSAFVQGSSKVIVDVNAADIGVDITGYTSTAAQGLYLSGASGVVGRVNAQGVNSGCTNGAGFNATLADERVIDVTTYQSTDNVLHINADSIGRTIQENDTSDKNTYHVQDTGELSASVLTGSDSIVYQVNDGQFTSSYGGVNLSTLRTANAQEVTEAAALNKEYSITSAITWLIRTVGTIPARFGYVVSTKEWQWRAGGSGVIFKIDENGPVAPNFTVATLPASGTQPGAIAYATDGRKAGEGAGVGTGVQVFIDSTDTWIAVDSGSAVLA